MSLGRKVSALAVVLVMAASAGAAAAPGAEAYSLGTGEAKRALLHALRQHGYAPDSTREWYCGQRSRTRVSCDLYFYDYSDGETYCGGGTVRETAESYLSNWSLSTVDCGLY